MFHIGVIKFLVILFVFQVSTQKETSRGWCPDNDFRNSCNSEIEHSTYLVLLSLWYGKIFIELFFTHIIKTLTFKRKKKLIFFLKLSSIMILEMLTLFFNDEKKLTYKFWNAAQNFTITTMLCHVFLRSKIFFSENWSK